MQRKLLILMVTMLFAIANGFAQFAGDFASGNWQFTTDHFDATLDLSDDPNSIRIVGGDDGIDNGNTDFTISVVGSGTIKFRWCYFSTDLDGASFDPAGYLLNGEFIFLLDEDGPPNQSGELDVMVSDGDQFGFRVSTQDGDFGAGELTIFDFAPFSNSAPNIAPIADQYVGVNSGPVEVDLEGISAGVGEDQMIIVTATSSNQDLIVDPLITYVSPNDVGTLVLTLEPEATGSTDITVTVTDDGGTANGGSDTYQTQFAVFVEENFPPTLNILSPKIIPFNSAPIDINLSGITSGPNASESQILAVTASSSNPTLISTEITYTSPENSGILTITPAAEGIGAAIISVTVTDDGTGPSNSFSREFPVTLLPNSPPEIGPVADVFYPVNVGAAIILLNGITSGDEAGQDIQLSASTDNPGLLLDLVVDYTSPDNSGFISFTVAPDMIGTAEVTLSLTDNGGTAQGGNDIFETSFRVNVSGNFQPQIDDIADVIIQTNSEPFEVQLNNISPGPFENQGIVITASSDNPTLIPDPAVTYTSPESNGVLVLEPIADTFGAANITVTVTDNGGTDFGGVDQLTKTFTVQVIGGNMPPSMNPLPDLFIGKNSGLQVVRLENISDGDGFSQTLFLSATSSNPVLIPNPDIFYEDGETTGILTFTSLPDATGSATVTVELIDDGGVEDNGFNAEFYTFDIIVSNNFEYTAEVSNAPTVERPNQDFGLSGETVGYHSQPLKVETSGIYRFRTKSANFDTFLALYSPIFDPSDPLKNLVLASSGLNSVFGDLTLTIEAGRQYDLITFGQRATSTGTFTNEIIGDGPVQSGAIPTLDFIEDRVTQEDVPIIVAISGISDGKDNSTNLSLTSESVDTNLINNVQISYTSPESTASLEIIPVENAFGSTHLTVSVSSGETTTERSFVITVDPVNDVPTGISLELTQQSMVGERIGVFSTVDVDIDDEHQYALVAGDGDVNNGLFSIADDGLVLENALPTSIPDNLVRLRVSTTDMAGGTYVEALTISVGRITSTHLPAAIDLKPFPNPAKDIIYLPLDASTTAVKITTSTGSTVKEYQIEDFNTPLDLSDLRSGTYLIRVERQQEQPATYRIVKN